MVVFTNDGKRNREIATHAGKANVVVRDLFRSGVTKRELLNSAKL